MVDGAGLLHLVGDDLIALVEEQVRSLGKRLKNKARILHLEVYVPHAEGAVMTRRRARPYGRAYRLKYPWRVPARRCATCGELFQPSETDTGKRWKHCSAACSRKAHVQAIRRYQARNAEKLKRKRQRYRAEHADELRARDRESQRRKRLERGDEVRARERRYYRANLEKMRAQNNAYKASNREKRRLAEKARRDRKRAERERGER